MNQQQLNSLLQLVNSPWFPIIIIWSLVWTGIALWKSAKRGHIYWYIVFLVVHTLGLLEMLYIFVITPWIDSRKGKKEVSNQ